MADLISIGAAIGDGTGEPPRSAWAKLNALYAAETRAAVTALSVPTAINAFRTHGYAAAGDGGGALYKRVVAQPAHAGKVQSLDGAWWEMAEPVANILAFGADPTDTAASDTAINDAMSYATAKTPSLPLYIPHGIYRVDATLTHIPTEFTIFGDGPHNSVLHPRITNGTACLKIVSGTQAVTFRDFGVSCYANFAAFQAGTPAPDCIGIDGSDITFGHCTRYMWSNVWVDSCLSGVKIDGWIGTIQNLFITACDTGFTGLELNGTTLNLIAENCRKSFDISDSFSLTMLTLQDEGDVSGQVSSRLNSSHSVTFINPYWEAGLAYPRTTPYLVIGDFYICQSVDVIGGMVETINLPRTVNPIDIQWLHGGNFQVYCSVGSVGSGIGLGIKVGNVTNNITVNQSNGIGTWAYQDFSNQANTNYNLMPNSNFDVWLRGYEAVNLNNAVLAQDLWTVRRGHSAAKITASVGTSNNYVEFVLPKLKQVYKSFPGMTFRVGAWIYIPNITEYNDGTLAKIPDISIGWTDNAAAFVESSTTHPGTLATGTWSYVYALVTPSDLVTDVRVRVYANRTANNATGNEVIYCDAITIMHASTSLERQMRESYVNDPYLPVYAHGVMRALGNATPTDANQAYERGDMVLIQEPEAYTSPGWLCTGAGAGGTATWSRLPATDGRGLVAAMPLLTGATYKGARYYATNGRNSGEGAGAGTGCWATLNNAGGWIADWSGATITD